MQHQPSQRPPEDSEEYIQVVQDFCDGDHDAFATLVEWYESSILAFISTRIFGKEPNDVSQNVWAKVWRYHATFGGDRNFRAWLFKIASSQVNEEFRHIQRRRIEKSHGEEELIDQQVSPELESELIVALRECLRTVGGKFTDALRMELDGLSPEEIAEKIGLSVGAVYSRKNRGRSELKECIERRMSP